MVGRSQRRVSWSVNGCQKSFRAEMALAKDMDPALHLTEHASGIPKAQSTRSNVMLVHLSTEPHLAEYPLAFLFVSSQHPPTWQGLLLYCHCFFAWAGHHCADASIHEALHNVQNLCSFQSVA